jgi:hypothetical protein
MDGTEIIKDYEKQAEGLDFSKLRAMPKPESEYPALDTIIDFIKMNEAEHEINIDKLALMGTMKAEPIEVYLNTPAISSSICKEYLKTPLHGFYAEHKTLPKKDKKHFDLGTFAHMAFLEPALFDKVMVEPAANLSSHAGCDKLLNFYADCIQTAFENGLIEQDAYMAINPYDFEGLKKPEDKRARIENLKLFCPYQFIDEEHKIIIDVLKSNYYRYGNGIIPRLLKGAIHEISMYGNDPETGLLTKIRPDGLNVKENIGVDAIISFKTTASDNLGKFIYDSAKYSYELTEGMYQEVASHITGRKFNTTIMIMLQTVPPYLPAVFMWDADDLQNGKYKYRNALTTIKECQDENKYPGFDAMAEAGHFGIIKMKQPEWAMKELHPVDLED